MSVQVGYYEAWRDLMRSWGFTVHEAAGWRTRDAASSRTYLPGKLYIEHHDASTTKSGNWGALNYIISNRLANIVTARNGEITIVAAGPANHAGVGSRNSLGDIPPNQANWNSLGNEVANNGLGEPYSEACTRAIIASEAAWAIVSGRVNDVMTRVLGHKEWADPPGRKTDPLIDMNQRRRDVAAFIQEKLRPAPPVVDQHEYADPEPGSLLRTPVQEGTYRITSGFGPRGGSEHRGVDFASVTPGKDYSGAPIFAMEDGVVIEGAERQNVGGFGGWVWTRHEINGEVVDTIIGHMYQRDIRVRKGDWVKRGQLIALVGDNGDTNGAHAHAEVWVGGNAPRETGHAVDPMPYLERKAAPPATPMVPGGEIEYVYNHLPQATRDTLGRVTVPEHPLPDAGGGALVKFEGLNGHIYWAQRTNRACLVLGAILAAYGTQDWERGPLGWPLSHEFEWTRIDRDGQPHRMAQSNFEGGYIVFDHETATAKVVHR